ncbi:MAG: winged helix-turn-helix transcriptional regulator [Elusimicrobia bacterium]|nr:winged helix-turn-helix transcriptional regulator [Elusimicrobiota bacterium]
MNIKQARQLLKSLADDTRLRIINLLKQSNLSVLELCKILGSNQSNVSKHLARLRLTGIVTDKRELQFVYYFLTESKDRFHQDLMDCITKSLAGIDTFKKDLLKLETVKNKSK